MLKHCKSPRVHNADKMQDNIQIYEPQEDSMMLERHAKQYAFGNVLDMGTGSGIQAIAAAQSPKVKSVLATDIQKGAVEYCKKHIKNKKIRFLQSDLFENLKGKFDTIIFNPPYLPQEPKLKDLTLEGGKKGYEVIERFLDRANQFLSPEGIVLLVFSSLTKRGKVEGIIKNKLFEFEELERSHVFFEDIYVYLLKKSEFLKKLERKGVSNMKYLARGHRGLLFTGTFKNKKVAVKTENPGSRAVNRIQNEAKWLEKLNKRGIGPKVLFSDGNYFVSEYIDGCPIGSYLQKSNKTQIKKIITIIFNQLFALDRLKVDKEEMHRPLKHIIVRRGIPCLIDFERAHYSPKPKNVTQFCQFLATRKLKEMPENKKIYLKRDNLIQLSRIYKSKQNTTNLNKIISAIYK